MAAVLAAAAVGAAGCGSNAAKAPAPVPGPLPPVKHVFIVVLENKDYEPTFGSSPVSSYIARDLPARGQLLTQYHGVAHHSLPNYLALVSGQPPTSDTQADCPVYSDFKLKAIEAGIAAGQGCVYPPAVRTVADQLEARGMTWKGYMQDMKTPCRHPAIGAVDDAHSARPGDMYATRHNPFVYFHSIIDRPSCARNDVPLDALTADLQRAATTPNLAFISPDLCSDGHDKPCADGRPGGLASAEVFLREWVPRITASPAFRRDGMLVVTFDEAYGDGSACCGEQPGPNVDQAGGPEGGDGGGRTGTVVISPFVKPGSRNDTPYNHYSLLRTVEDLFGVPHLGYAGQKGLARFGRDVFGRPAGG